MIGAVVETAPALERLVGESDRPRTGLALRDPLPWHDFVQVVTSAEDEGYEAVFLPEIAGRESFSALSGLAGVTDRLMLGTGVVTVGARTLPVTAMAAATVHELSGGRLVLGIGSGMPGPGSLDAVRAFAGGLRAAFQGRTLPDGSALALEGDPPPILLAALGERMVALAGEVADGILLNWCTPERVERARRTLAEAAERAGRDGAELAVAVYVRANVGPEHEAALEALGLAATIYAGLPHYRRQFEAMGLGEEAARAADGDGETLARAVCLWGDPREAADRLDAYREAGADLPVVYPVPTLDAVSSILGTVLALAPATSR